MQSDSVCRQNGLSGSSPPVTLGKLALSTSGLTQIIYEKYFTTTEQRATRGTQLGTLANYFARYLETPRAGGGAIG
jgi:hypothetical protein